MYLSYQMNINMEVAIMCPIMLPKYVSMATEMERGLYIDMWNDTLSLHGFMHRQFYNVNIQNVSRYVPPMRDIHYRGVIMSTMRAQITSLMLVYSTVYPGAGQRKHQSPALLAFVRGIHRWPGNFSCKGPVKRKIFQFDDVIICAPKLYVTTWSTIA